MMRRDSLNAMSDNRHHEAFTLRCVVPDDQDFLYELYCSTRREEMTAWGWDSAQQEGFLKLQFTAQRRHHDIAFPEADHRIILSENRPIGRIVVFRTVREIRLVDISLLPEHRGSGKGTSVILGLIEEAKQTDKSVTLHVDKLNRAARLYQRLGFSIVGETGADYRMEWRPVVSSGDWRVEV